MTTRNISDGQFVGYGGDVYRIAETGCGRGPGSRRAGGQPERAVVASACQAVGRVPCGREVRAGCSNLYNHWQSSALGIPNAYIGIPMFAVIAGTTLAGATGAGLHLRVYRWLLGLQVFFAAFITWYLQQSTMVIGALCLYCTVCAFTILLALGATLRAAHHAGAFTGGGRVAGWLAAVGRSGTDLILVGGWAVLIATMIGVGLFWMR